MPPTSSLLAGGLALVVFASFALSPRVRSVDGFFRGFSEDGRAPGVLTLTLSQVTTWIFARSLLTAAILGYVYGIAGALAYAAYYLSFLTGGWLVDRIRFGHGAPSVQAFLVERFGRVGVGCYNLVLVLRLLSEVFANLLVVGIVFGVTGSTGYLVAMLAVGGLTLAYAMLGGLRASLRTDVFQASLLILLLAGLLLMAVGEESFALPALAGSSADPQSGGWVLLLVALLQVWSYPLHDPVMIDRGFLADRRTTARSFLHACWLSVLLILAFGVVGVWAGLERQGAEDFLATLHRLLGDWALLVVNLALIVSAISTLDSTFSSAAKLAVVDMRLSEPTVSAGRWWMVLFAVGGLVLVWAGSDDLYTAVAVSGTASLFLTPVVFFSILWGRDVATWSYLVSFAAAVTGSVLYYLESGGHMAVIGTATGYTHAYSKLLVVDLVIVAVGFAAFAFGLRPRGEAYRT